jgi:hypothetical protein
MSEPSSRSSSNSSSDESSQNDLKRRDFLSLAGAGAAGAVLGGGSGCGSLSKLTGGSSSTSTGMAMCVDYNDAVAENEELFDEDMIDRFFQRCAAKNVKRIYWRVSATGNVLYHSKVRTVFKKGPPSWREGHEAKLLEILRKFDPMEVACTMARKNGLEIYPWVTLFDEGKGVSESDFSRKNQEYVWVSRDQKHRQHGLLCYFYPEVMEHRVAQIRELCQYDIDGLVLSTRSHSRPEDGHIYGFNEPVIKRFQDKYDADPREGTLEVFHLYRADLFHKLLGEQLTEFLAAAKAEMRDKSLFVVVKKGQEAGYPMGGMHLDYPQWAKRGLVDGLIVGGMEWIAVPPIAGFPHETIDAICADPGFWDRWYVDGYKRACGGDVEIQHWFRLWGWKREYKTVGALESWVGQTKSPENIAKLMTSFRESKLDCVALFEAVSINFDDALWDALS